MFILSLPPERGHPRPHGHAPPPFVRDLSRRRRLRRLPWWGSLTAMADSRWSESVRWTATIALLVGLLALGLTLVPVIPALSIAALLAYLLNPFVGWLMRRGRLGRAAAGRIVYLFFLLLLVNIPAWLGALVVSQIGALEALLRGWADRLHLWLARPIDLSFFRFEPESLVTGLENAVRDALQAVPAGPLTLIANVTTNLFWAIVVLVLLYYLLKDGPCVKWWLVRAAPPLEQAAFARLLDEVDAIWGRFLRVQVVMFAALTLAIGLGSALVIWIYSTGVLGSSPLVLILGLLAVYTLLQQLDNLWLRPHFLGRSLQLHPGVVFVGLIAGLLAAGILGALFSVPFIATGRAFFAYLQSRFRGAPAAVLTPVASTPAAARPAPVAPARAR
jgi:putative heme transporter